MSGTLAFEGVGETRASACRSNSLHSSVYFVPRESDFRSRAAFVAAVRLEGTGVQKNGTVLRYNGRVQRLPGGCQTAVGAAGRCLKPFFSVAADFRTRPSPYRMGDIIFIPELKGKEIYLPAPQNRKIIHPGYFIVEDTGSAIRGSNRFDFFTGSMGPYDARNAFGYRSPRIGRGPYSMTDRNQCDKSFQVIRQGTAGWQAANTQIENAYSGVRPSATGLLAQGESERTLPGRQ